MIIFLTIDPPIIYFAKYLHKKNFDNFTSKGQILLSFIVCIVFQSIFFVFNDQMVLMHGSLVIKEIHACALIVHANI